MVNLTLSLGREDSFIYSQKHNLKLIEKTSSRQNAYILSIECTPHTLTKPILIHLSFCFTCFSKIHYTIYIYFFSYLYKPLSLKSYH